MSTPVPHGYGRRGTKADWVGWAEWAISSYMEQALAGCYLVELETALHERGVSDAKSKTGTTTFDPHIITEAVNNLIAHKKITVIEHKTRGCPEFRGTSVAAR